MEGFAFRDEEGFARFVPVLNFLADRGRLKRLKVFQVVPDLNCIVP